MTSCPKCHGCIHWEAPEWGEPIQARCVNGGWRKNEPLPVKPRDPYSRKDKCMNCHESVEAGYRQCPKCRAYQKRYRETGERRKRTGPILPVVLLVEKP